MGLKVGTEQSFSTCPHIAVRLPLASARMSMATSTAGDEREAPMYNSQSQVIFASEGLNNG